MTGSTEKGDDQRDSMDKEEFRGSIEGTRLEGNWQTESGRIEWKSGFTGEMGEVRRSCNQTQKDSYKKLIVCSKINHNQGHCTNRKKEVDLIKDSGQKYGVGQIEKG